MKVDPDKYLFWDDFHPTVHGEYDLAQLASQSLITAGMAMPEPSAIILLMTGAVGIGCCGSGRVAARGSWGGGRQPTGSGRSPVGSARSGGSGRSSRGLTDPRNFAPVHVEDSPCRPG